MNAMNIRITRRTGSIEEAIDIEFHKPQPLQLFTSKIEAIAKSDPDQDTLVPGNADDMADALAQISTELQCANTLDDILHAIDARTAQQPVLEWSATLCDGKSVNYDTAEKACKALGEGWRLPTRFELESILDLTRREPAIDTTRFPDTKSGYYWSSTPCAWSSDSAWIVSFNGGYVDGNHRGYSYGFVRAVRASQ